MDAERQLLDNLKTQRLRLAALLEEASSHWGYEDPVYRFYHQSWKVYHVQARTEAIVKALTDLLPGRPLNSRFSDIIRQGTGHVFAPEDNQRWTAVTRPILEAFFHARYFLEMARHYADRTEPPQPLPSGYAALLYLFNLR